MTPPGRAQRAVAGRERTLDEVPAFRRPADPFVLHHAHLSQAACSFPSAKHAAPVCTAMPTALSCAGPTARPRPWSLPRSSSKGRTCSTFSRPPPPSCTRSSAPTCVSTCGCGRGSYAAGASGRGAPSAPCGHQAGPGTVISQNTLEPSTVVITGSTASPRQSARNASQLYVPARKPSWHTIVPSAMRS